MTNQDAVRTVSVSSRAYRWLDRASKLTGVALVAAGLDAGGGTVVGLGLAALGVACGLFTVFIPTQ